MPSPPGGGPTPYSRVQQAVQLAESYAGRVPYVFGGATPSGFDCSGLVQYVYNSIGVHLPRTSEEQAKVGTPVSYNQLQVGDLVFSSWGGEDPHGHVAIYTGNGKIVEAPHTGEDVHVVPLNSFYLAHVTDYRRVGNVSPTPAGIPGAGNLANAATGGLISWPADMLSFFTDATDVLTGQASWIKAFFQPSTYIRIGAGFFGFLFLIAALFFLVREGRS